MSAEIGIGAGEVEGGEGSNSKDKGADDGFLNPCINLQSGISGRLLDTGVLFHREARLNWFFLIHQIRYDGLRRFGDIPCAVWGKPSIDRGFADTAFFGQPLPVVTGILEPLFDIIWVHRAKFYAEI
ncbi:MAG: hypothetical protein EBS21_02355 [Sphingomonadaceae bacterium]|nr:hypothetical protein [Sphingomonadaceae bacterium]